MPSVMMPSLAVAYRAVAADEERLVAEGRKNLSESGPASLASTRPAVLASEDSTGGRMFRFCARLGVVVSVCSIFFPAAEAQAQAPALNRAPSSTWTGVYLGASGGQGRGTPASRIEWNDTALADGPHPPAVPADYAKRVDGMFGGGQLGWNSQRGRVVSGVEADLSFAQIEGDISIRAPLSPPFITGYGYEERLELKRVGTARGRLGITPASRWLLFVTGGLAYGEAQADTNLRFFSLNGVQSVQYPGSATESRMGWTIGGGTEVALGAAWSAKADYLHVDLGTMNVRGIRDPAFPAIFTVSEQAVKGALFRFGLNYRFGAR